MDNRKAFMRQETNADLQEKIGKQSLLIKFLIGFIVGMFLILILKWTWFAIGMIIGAVLVSGFKIARDEEYKPEWE